MPITFEEVTQTVLNLVRELELVKLENTKLRERLEQLEAVEQKIV